MTKEEIRLEQMKIKVKRADLQWDYFVLQEQLKSLMYVERSLRGDKMKGNLTDEFRERENKQVLCWYYIKKEVYYSS